MTSVVLTLLVLLGYLVWERVWLARTRQAIPLVIAVTGTRGKSSVARALGAVLREDGRAVLIKTTGTEAQYVLPDGSVEQIRRRGVPSILEQKTVLGKAVRLGVDTLVVEVMSIEAANHIIESHRILRPSVVIITNVRKDHTDAMGESLEDIAATLALCAVPGAQVFVPQEQAHLFVPMEGTTWTEVTLPHQEGSRSPAPVEFPVNDRLVRSVAASLGVEGEPLEKGLQSAHMDRGAFRIWRREHLGQAVYFVNAFAANDPDSTRELFDHARAQLGMRMKAIGIFAVRQDRGARTLQWVEALRQPEWEALETVFLVGDVPRALAGAIDRSIAIAGRDARTVTNAVCARLEAGGMVFGFGNTHGVGLELIDYWNNGGQSDGT